MVDERLGLAGWHGHVAEPLKPRGTAMSCPSRHNNRRRVQRGPGLDDPKGPHFTYLPLLVLSLRRRVPIWLHPERYFARHLDVVLDIIGLQKRTCLVECGGMTQQDSLNLAPYSWWNSCPTFSVCVSLIYQEENDWAFDVLDVESRFSAIKLTGARCRFFCSTLYCAVVPVLVISGTVSTIRQAGHWRHRSSVSWARTPSGGQSLEHWLTVALPSVRCEQRHVRPFHRVRIVSQVELTPRPWPWVGSGDGAGWNPWFPRSARRSSPPPRC